MDYSREWLSEIAMFSAVAERLSFSLAAEKLGVTSSAVSKSVSRLERRLNTKLFLRTTRAVQLTEVGEFYLNRTRLILADIQSLEAEVERGQDELRGTLRVSAPLMFGHAQVMPVVIQFQKQHPDVRLEVDLTDRVCDILEERVDIAIRMTSSPPESFVARKLCRDERILCASPKYVEKYGVPKTPKDLANHQGVIFCKADIPVPWQLFPTKKHEKSGGYLPQSKMHLSSIMSVYDATKAGLGISNLPSYVVEEDFKCHRLVQILKGYVESPRFVWAVYPGNRVIPRKVKIFVDELRKHFAHWKC